MHERFLPDPPQRTATCPYCGSNETELFSLFGQQLLTLQYYCRACHTPFEYVRDDDVLDDRETTGFSDPPRSSR